MRVVVLFLVCFVVLVSANVPRDMIREVAQSFAEKGYVRQDPYELSPQQAQHAALMEYNNQLTKSAPSNEPAPEDRLTENLPEEIALRNKVEQELQELLAKQKSMPPPTLMETQAMTTTSNFRTRRVGFILDTAASIYSKVKGVANKLTGKYKPSNSQMYEDCMACRMVWKQVEMDISNARYVEDVQASFEHNCMDAQKSSIFYKSCEDMYDDIYAMTDDYMSGQYTVDQICQRAKLCLVPVT